MKSKYVNAMNEIKADDDLKQSIIRNIGMDTKPSQTSVRLARRKFIVISVSCLVICLLAIGGPFVFRDRNQAHPSALFNGFVITAYAADGVPVMIKPNVEFPLGEYSMFMSSAPGFPVTIVSEGADEIEIQTSKGQLLLWDYLSDSKVLNQGKKVSIQSGETFYWTPSTDGDPSQLAAADSTLKVTAYKKGTKLGGTTIQIQTEDDVTYKAKLINEKE